jgi:hypothetical protein
LVILAVVVVLVDLGMLQWVILGLCDEATEAMLKAYRGA